MNDIEFNNNRNKTRRNIIILIILIILLISGLTILIVFGIKSSLGCNGDIICFYDFKDNKICFCDNIQK